MIGSQINFYFTPIDENLFLEEIKRSGDKLLNYEGENLNIDDALTFNKKSISEVFIKTKQSKLYFKSNKVLDIDKSEVIQYSRSISKLFFTPSSFPDSTFEDYVSEIHNKPLGTISYRNGRYIKTKEIPLEELKKDYELLLKKRSIDDKRILKSGRLWAAMRYVNNNVSDFIEKETWFKDWYDFYAKWIKKNCRMSKGKYHDYIGKDAYRKYKAGEYTLPSYYQWE